MGRNHAQGLAVGSPQNGVIEPQRVDDLQEPGAQAVVDRVGFDGDKTGSNVRDEMLEG